MYYSLSKVWCHNTNHYGNMRQLIIRWNLVICEIDPRFGPGPEMYLGKFLKMTRISGMYCAKKYEQFYSILSLLLFSFVKKKNLYSTKWKRSMWVCIARLRYPCNGQNTKCVSHCNVNFKIIRLTNSLYKFICILMSICFPNLYPLPPALTFNHFHWPSLPL